MRADRKRDHGRGSSGGPKRSELARQRVSPLRDIPRSETNHDIAGLRQALDHGSKIVRSIECNDLPMSMGAQTLDQGIPVGTRDRHLACRINMADDYAIGIVEAGRELVEQGGEPRIAVQL